MDDIATQVSSERAAKERLAEQEQQAIRESQRSQNIAEQLAKQYPGRAVSASGSGGVNIGATAHEPSLRLSLTPAQEAAERTVGKQIADFASAGGRPSMQKNLQALKEVQGDLVPNGKRDLWDRAVGTAFGTSPALLGLFGSTEKARRDKARNTALTIAKQTDPNPTEKQIEAIMGQIYDPSSSNEDNESRINRFLQEQESKMSQMEQAAQNYNKTGYATLGRPDPIANLLKPQKQTPSGLSAEEQVELDQLRKELGK